MVLAAKASLGNGTWREWQLFSCYCMVTAMHDGDGLMFVEQQEKCCYYLAFI